MTDSSISSDIYNGARHLKRDRSRERAGKSERSYIKHEFIRRVVGGQIGVWRLRNSGRIAIIDGNAGDGEGVDLRQQDLFAPSKSLTTAEIATQIASKVGNAVVILCEKDKHRRAALETRFRSAVIVADNALAPAAIPPDCEYAVWISDPCGPANHGLESMRQVAQSVCSDFVIAFNEGWIASRCAGLTGMCADDVARRSSLTMRDRYLPMIAGPTWWAGALGRRHLSRTPIINVAPNFRCRILVVADYLADSAKRHPFEAIL